MSATMTQTLGSHRNEQIAQEYEFMWGLLGHDRALRRLADAYDTTEKAIEHIITRRNE